MSEPRIPDHVDVPTADAPVAIPIEAGSTITFCGANGSGKTRLAVHLEKELGLIGHRISAHRALSLNPRVPKISEEDALANLRTGTVSSLQHSNRVQFRSGSRWQDNEAVLLLNDFDHLVQALFAEQANTALESHRRLRRGKCLTAKPTKFEKLSAIWGRLLPHRTLVIDGDDINVRNREGGDTYTASQMSDGERAMFYLIGQTLVASEDSVLIVDEPELHIHPAAMTALWDELAATRPDCVFVFITHSLEFAATRPGPKYSILEFHPDPDHPSWTLEDVPDETGFDEDFTTLILGSRKPVLFVEGNRSTSLDHFVYRATYPDHLVLPRHSASEVIHAVASLRANPAFTRVSCWGLVDRDSRSSDEIDQLRSRHVYVLPVAEIENVFLLPDVARALAASGGYEGEQRERLIGQLHGDVLTSCASSTNLDRAVVRAARRYIDRHLKHLDLKDATTTQDLDALYRAKTTALNIADLASRIRDDIQSALDARDLPAVLERYDDKGLFALAAQSLRDNNAKAFKKWLERVLTNGSEPELAAAIRACLPVIPAQ
ncbi:MAG: AAA family ATPase [Gammaproteobacteria bacterium]|nr:AAA family ATPase [Gammaproteobacteria bacterium]MYB35957.1 AAA family ATPase [Gammaproteobacteria bacterium]